MCVLTGIQSVDIGACMHVCVRYTELTWISNGTSKTDIVVGKVLCVCVRADIMGRVLDPLLCVFLAGIQSVGIGACMHVCVR